jgi:branched-chain amino acid transport system substrate-binding protein
MRKLLMKAGAPLLAGGLAVAGFSSVASASATTHVKKPSYTIAYEGPLTGGNQQLGLNMIYSVELAISQFNHKAGNAFTLKFQALNDQGDETIAPNEARIAVSNPHVVGVVGPAFSGATKAAQAVYGPANMPLVSPSATNTLLTTPAENPHHNFFRVVADDAVQGPADAIYVVTKLKLKSIYIVNDASDYGSGLAGQFAHEAKHLGAKVTTNTADGTTGCMAGTGSDTEYAPLATEIFNSHDKVVFYGGYYCDFSLLTAALKTAGYTGKLMSGDGSDDPHYISGTSPEKDANGTYLTCPCKQLVNTPADRAFSAGFKKLSHNTPPGTYSPESYDAANTIIAAMVAIVKAHHAVTRLNIVKELRVITHVGLTKTIHFLANGNVASSLIYVNQVRALKIVQLGLT